MADTRLPATGRTPLSPSAMQAAMNRAALIDWQARILLLNLPAQIGRHNVTYPQPGLPETPLRSPVAIGAENLGLGLLAAAALQGYTRTLQLITLAKKSTIYSGHPGVDLPFWIAYFNSPKLQELIAEANAAVMSAPIPHESPVRARDLFDLHQSLYGFSTQQQLNSLFEFGKYGDLAAVEARIAQLKADRLYGLGVGDSNSYHAAIQQRIDSITAGVQLRPLLDLKQAIAQQRYEAVRALLPLLFQEPPAFEQQGLPALPAKSSDP